MEASRRLFLLVRVCLRSHDFGGASILSVSVCHVLKPTGIVEMLMSSCARHTLILAAVTMLCLPATVSADIDFAQQIRPILAENCFVCHGPDDNQRKADLRLDEETSDKDFVIIPGNASDSELFVRIASDDESMVMPPPHTGKSLSDEQIDLLRRWMDEGAAWSGHWAFESLRKPEFPEIAVADGTYCEIDRFVLRRLRQAGLSPSPEADRATLVRRLHLDLTGLPATRERAGTFIEDDLPNAWEKLVDELLASEHYGERMAVAWLDGARYADTNGFQNDFFRVQWLWRDWVIAAFNQNMPYDQFVVEQIAGDLLPSPSNSQLIATGFNRNNHTVTESGSIEEEWFIENAIDRVETTSTMFLGLTMGCTRCHSHKYDPITQTDFYRLLAFFNSVDEKGVYTEQRGNVGPQVSVPSKENRRQIAEFEAQISNIENQLAEMSENKQVFLSSFRKRILESAKQHAEEQYFERLRMVPPEPLQDLSHETVRPNLFPTAFQFSGAGGHFFREDLLFGADQSFSWSAWIYPEAEGAIFSTMAGEADLRGLDALVLKDGRLKIHLIDTWPDNALAAETRSPIRFGAWQYVAATWDGSGSADGLKIFVDGRQSPQKRPQDTLEKTASFQTGQPLRLGGRPGVPSFTGMISRFRIDERALTADQILAAHHADIAELLTDFGELKLLAPTADESSHRSVVIGGYLTELMKAEKKAELGTAKSKLEQYRKKDVPSVMVMRDRGKMRPTYRLDRGQYDAPDKSRQLFPAVPAFLPQLREDAPQNRLGLAQWLVSRDNPLVARVIVNRIWAKFFGQGIVSTLDNFGMQSSPPSHPKLIDWLAVDFIENGWDLKRLQKQIVMSNTYRSSSERSANSGIGPDNRLLARGSRFRLSAELIRDNALALSGLLRHRIGGPSVKPYQPAGLWQELAGGANDGPYKVDGPGGLYRKSLYTYRKRTVSHPTLSTFDAPAWETCTVRRARTNTPLQALALLNDTTYVEAGRKLAERMMVEAEGDVRERIVWAWSLATCRLPGQHRLNILTSAFKRYRTHFTEHPEEASQYLAIGVWKPDESLDPVNLAAYALVASTLLNLDEVITRE